VNPARHALLISEAITCRIDQARDVSESVTLLLPDLDSHMTGSEFVLNQGLAAV
jgi:hypothetical protein